MVESRGITMKLITVLLCLFSFSLLANDYNQEGKNFAKDKDLNLGGINATDVPGYTGEIPSDLTQYYDNGLAIEEAGRKEAQNNSTAQFIEESQATRPKYEIDKNNDPLFSNYDTIVDRSSNLSQTYSGCTELPYGSTSIDAKFPQCTILGRKEAATFNCKKTIEARCVFSQNDTTVNKHDYVLAEEFKSISHEMFNHSQDYIKPGSGVVNSTSSASTRTVNYISNITNRSKIGNGIKIDTNGINVSLSGNGRDIRVATFYDKLEFDIENIGLMEDIFLTRTTWDDWLFVYVNGISIFEAVGGNLSPDHNTPYRSEQNTVWGWQGRKDIKHLFKTGKNEIYIINHVFNLGGFTVNFEFSRLKRCDIEEDVIWRCENGENKLNGNLTNSQCSHDGDLTKLILGIPVTKSCWEFDEVYEKPNSVIYDDSDCSELKENKSCGQVKSECILSENGYCAKQLNTYQCTDVSSEKTVTLCGSNLICPDGNCTDDVGRDIYDATDDFKEAASSLAVADEIRAQFDADSLTIFSAKKLSCVKQNLGVKDCCKDSGWALGLGLTQCDAEEKELGYAKEAGQVHYVGSYTSGGILDKRTHKVYCSYPSKLSRIIMQQSNAQLNKPYGSAKSPICDGLTLEELDQVDFNQMDFSEYYEDVMKKATEGQPAMEQSIDSLKDKMQNRYGK